MRTSDSLAKSRIEIITTERENVIFDIELRRKLAAFTALSYQGGQAIMVDANYFGLRAKFKSYANTSAGPKFERANPFSCVA